MGTSPPNSVTDTNGRFHHVANAYCADQSLFVTVGSVNPTLTGLTLARMVTEAVIGRALGHAAPPWGAAPERGFGEMRSGPRSGDKAKPAGITEFSPWETDPARRL